MEQGAAYLDSQIDQFEAQLAELIAAYSGLYVAFENGRVLDADADYTALATRIYTDRPSRPPLIRRVEREQHIAWL